MRTLSDKVKRILQVKLMKVFEMERLIGCYRGLNVVPGMLE